MLNRTRVENRQRTPIQSKLYAIVPMDNTAFGISGHLSLYSATRGNKKDEKIFRIDRCLWRRQERLIR
ncbi:hypothetical protein V1478_000242 [Vespula squamosa]|uniref:Uncharacterized protein n=1 Tax=Vespula squamosa TaxID=30214 RepID=A0ABD2C4Y5_VESSQ